MCCATKYGLLGLLLSTLLGRGGCCPTAVPVDVTLSVAPASISVGGNTATVTAQLASAQTEEFQLHLRADQTPNTSSPAFDLSDSTITVPAGQTQGTVTVTPLALPDGVDSVQVVFRVSQVVAGDCSWDVDIPASPLTITAPPGGGSLQVTLCPDEAIAAGVQWNVDGGDPQDSGATVSGLSAGVHTVDFLGVDGWIAPPSEEVTIVDGQTTQLTRCFDP